MVAVYQHFSEAMDAVFTSNSQKIVIATDALFNFGRMLNDEPPDDGVHGEDFFADENDFVVIDGDDRTTRFRGQTERDRLCMNMR